MFRNGCVIKKHAQLSRICCLPPLSNLKGTSNCLAEFQKTLKLTLKFF